MKPNTSVFTKAAAQDAAGGIEPTAPPAAGEAASAPAAPAPGPAAQKQPPQPQQPAAVPAVPSPNRTSGTATAQQGGGRQDLPNPHTTPNGTVVHKHPGYPATGEPVWHDVNIRHRNRAGQDITVKLHEAAGLGADGYGTGQTRDKLQAAGKIPADAGSGDEERKIAQARVQRVGQTAGVISGAVGRVLGTVAGAARQMFSGMFSSDPLSPAQAVFRGVVEDGAGAIQQTADSIDRAYGISDGSGQDVRDTLKGRMWTRDREAADTAQNEGMERYFQYLQDQGVDDISEMSTEQAESLMDEVAKWKGEQDEKQRSGVPLTTADRAKLKLYGDIYTGIVDREKSLAKEHQAESTRERQAAAHEKRVAAEAARQKKAEAARKLAEQYTSATPERQMQMQAAGFDVNAPKAIAFGRDGMPMRGLGTYRNRLLQMQYDLQSSDQLSPEDQGRLDALNRLVDRADAKIDRLKPMARIYLDPSKSAIDNIRPVDRSVGEDGMVNTSTISVRRNRERAANQMDRIEAQDAKAYFDAKRSGKWAGKPLKDWPQDAQDAYVNLLASSPRYRSYINFNYNLDMASTYRQARTTINRFVRDNQFSRDPAVQEKIRQAQLDRQALDNALMRDHLEDQDLGALAREPFSPEFDINGTSLGRLSAQAAENYGRRTEKPAEEERPVGQNPETIPTAPAETAERPAEAPAEQDGEAENGPEGVKVDRSASDLSRLGKIGSMNRKPAAQRARLQSAWAVRNSLKDLQARDPAGMSPEERAKTAKMLDAAHYNLAGVRAMKESGPYGAEVAALGGPEGINELSKQIEELGTRFGLDKFTPVPIQARKAPVRTSQTAENTAVNTPEAAAGTPEEQKTAHARDVLGEYRNETRKFAEQIPFYPRIVRTARDRAVARGHLTPEQTARLKNASSLGDAAGIWKQISDSADIPPEEIRKEQDRMDEIGRAEAVAREYAARKRGER